MQDDEVGDGTTSVTVLASELLKQADKLVEMRIHPQTIAAGWRKATAVARYGLTTFPNDAYMYFLALYCASLALIDCRAVQYGGPQVLSIASE